MRDTGVTQDLFSKIFQRGGIAYRFSTLFINSENRRGEKGKSRHE